MQNGIQQPLPGYELGFDHPIEPRFVRGCSVVTDLEVHQYLDELNEHITPELIESLAACMAELEDVEQCDILYTDAERIATSAGPMWPPLFDRVGLEFKQGISHEEYEYVTAARARIRSAHIRQGVELGGERFAKCLSLVAQWD